MNKYTQRPYQVTSKIIFHIFSFLQRQPMYLTGLFCISKFLYQCLEELTSLKLLSPTKFREGHINIWFQLVLFANGKTSISLHIFAGVLM